MVESLLSPSRLQESEKEEGCFDREVKERTREKERTLLLSVSVEAGTQGLAGGLHGGAVEGVARVDEFSGHDGR